MPEHFFVIGAQRSGTTYLYSQLDSHPEIEMARPLRPEPKYFLNDANDPFDIDAYHRACFSGKPAGWLWGEKATSYLESEKAARRIAAAFPRAHLVVILRDPVQRAISNYYFSVENGLETLPMDAAFRSEKERTHSPRTTTSVSPFAYLSRGRYIEYLDMYERHFSRHQIIILISEQFIGSPAAFHALCARLGVSRNHTPSTLYERINATAQPHLTLTPELQSYLVSYYREPNARLAEQYSLDLSHWPSYRR